MSFPPSDSILPVSTTIHWLRRSLSPFGKCYEICPFPNCDSVWRFSSSLSWTLSSWGRKIPLPGILDDSLHLVFTILFLLGCVHGLGLGKEKIWLLGPKFDVPSTILLFFHHGYWSWWVLSVFFKERNLQCRDCSYRTFPFHSMTIHVGANSGPSVFGTRIRFTGARN